MLPFNNRHGVSSVFCFRALRGCHARLDCVGLGVYWGVKVSFGQDQLRSSFHTGHGWFFAHSEGASFCFCESVPLSLFTCAFCLGRLKFSMRFCGWRFAPGFFCVLAPPLRGCFLGFRARRSEARCFFCLYLLVFVFGFLGFVGVATLF